jgi:PAS domain S-box-containing protein
MEILVMLIPGLTGMKEGMGIYLVGTFLLSLLSVPLLSLFCAREPRSLSEQADLSGKILEKEMELKAAVEKQELGTRLLSLTNNVPGMVYRGHRDWSLSFIGAEVEPVTGYSSEELTSGAARWKEIIHPDDLACVKESYRKAVKEQLKFLRVEYRIRHKNGGIRWVADRRQLMYDETGSFDYVDGLLLDITERKETDRRLAESEYRFRTIADLAVNGMLTADSRGNIDFFNRAAEHIFGYASEEVIGKNVTMLIPERYRNAHKAGMERFLETGENKIVGGTVELNALRKDGTEFPIELSIGTWGPREAPFFSAIVRDITKRKRAEEELRQSNSLLVGTLESTADGILVVDDKGRIASYNRKFLELWQIPEEIAALGDDNLALSHAIRYLKEPESFLKKVQELYNEKEAESFDVIEFKDGRVFERYSIPLKVEEKSVGRVWSFRDVTKRKRMEEEQQIFVSLVENSTDLIGIASLDGKVFYLNQAGQNLVGLDGLEEVRKTRIRDFALEKHLNPLREVQASLSKEGTWKGEAMIRNFKTGTPIPIEMHGFVIEDAKTGQPIAFATISRDISERKKFEEEMARNDKLESIGILAGGIAHDFNNLLTAIFGNITLAKMYANRQSEVYKRLEDSEKAAQRARDLTYQLLTFSKGGTPVKKTISLQELVKESASFVLRGSNVKCEFSFPGDLWPVEADEGQMSQVFNNLIINGAHAMSDGGTLQVYCGNVIVDQSDLPLAKGKYSLVSFMDHGTGIPREHLAKIFDPYFTTKKKGSGLGLSTSYSIVRGHRGYLMVESDLGIGTTFTIYLPASEEGKRLSCAEEERFVTGKGRILVMDDEEAVREVAQGMLETLGYSVTLVKDGTEAIELYKVAMASGVPFDSVLMDLTIPGGIGGQEAVKRLLEIDPNVRAIVCSGYSNDTVLANFKRFGFRAVIPKPFSLQELSGTISDVLSTTP